MRYSPLVWGVLLLLFIAPSGFAEEPACPLRIRLCDKPWDENQPAFMGTYAFVLENLGETEVAVLTRFPVIMGFGTIPQSPQEFLLINILPDSPSGGNGVVVIPNITDYRPVTLRKNEGVVLDISSYRPFNNSEQMRVAYSVSEQWAKRFGLWQGRVVSPAYKMENGVVTNQEVEPLTKVLGDKGYGGL